MARERHSGSSPVAGTINDKQGSFVTHSTVLIVGAGPVGLTLATELVRLGVDTRIVEKASAPTALSKALVVWPRTLELLRRAGYAEQMHQAGREIRRAALFAGARRIGQIAFDGVATPYPFALFIPQSETERLLGALLERLGGAIERQVELTTFAARADGVEAQLRHADGRIETITADYLVGCDGAHSAVRHGLGTDFAGVSEQGTWILGDVRVSSLEADHLGLFWHATGVLAVFPMTGGRCRIIADLGERPDVDTAGEPTLALLQSVLDQRGPGGATASDPQWLSFFKINERKVKDYRHGRVFLAGDAAHIHSPAGGQGMNTGMQDAFNLAWKLAAVAQKRAGDTLLDTYSPERSAVGETVLANAARLTRIATLRSPAAQWLRNTIAPFILRLPRFRRAFGLTMTELAVAYPASALSQGQHRGLFKPGDRAPDATTRIDGKSAQLFDVLNTAGFTLLAVGADDGTIAHAAMPFGDYVKALAIPNEGEAAQRYGAGLFVIRPDWYVGLAAAAGDVAAASTYLAAWTTTLPSQGKG
ncbi:MAG TPA: FAD-dependent monooxygenase [Magnetospirillaceae bacterium]|jgi:2-polyprenyl-6-methoxyphenol hydroxylase-like FAD-dependent oxidoreductase